MLTGVGAAQAADLVISNWDGYMAKDIAETFKAATGLEIEVVNHATNEETAGKLMASQGKGYDVVFVSSPFAEILNHQGSGRAARQGCHPEPREPLPRGLQSRLRSRQCLFGSLYLGHDRPLLSLRPGEDRAGQLDEPARAVRRHQGQDHDAGDRSLADGGGRTRQGLFGQRGGSGKDRRGQGSADPGEEDASRL